MKITAWVLEDDDIARTNAIEGIQQIARELQEVTFDIWSSPILEWGETEWPALRNKDGNRAPNQLPDIVVLDLLDEHYELKGDSFYKRLRNRERENNQKKAYNAFVIIWTNYHGERDSEKFVRESDAIDSRFIALERKSPLYLKDRIKCLLGRIKEES